LQDITIDVESDRDSVESLGAASTDICVEVMQVPLWTKIGLL